MTTRRLCTVTPARRCLMSLVSAFPGASRRVQRRLRFHPDVKWREGVVGVRLKLCPLFAEDVQQVGAEAGPVASADGSA